MIATTEPEKFDAIVIGSGIGGLTVAALLSKLYHKKVLVLEQHFTPGGFTHGFERKGKFHWDVGLHYIGELGSGSPWRAVLDYLSNGKLQWQKMPDPFEKFVYPDFTFEVYADPIRYQADLIKKFPAEAQAIRQYFRDTQTAATWSITNGMLDLFPLFLQPIVKRIFRYFDGIARQTTQEYLDTHFQDIRLKAVLVSQWGDYGLPPSQSCFGIHSTIVTHFLEGGWYPVGGGKSIAQTIIPTIKQGGGKIVTQQRVMEILVKNGTAVGVKVQHAARPDSEPKIYHAPIIVSNAGVANTYLKLIPASYPLAEREEIKAFPQGSNVVSLYVGLKESPQKLGFQGENHWIFGSYDQQEVADDLPISAERLPLFAYLSFPSLKDPLAKGHTAEILGAGIYEEFTQWRDKSWRRRGDDYNELKSQITQSLLNLVESHYPGFQDLVEYTELSTPLTVEHFAASDRGVIYGIPYIPQRFDRRWISSRTPIKNLYLTGSDTFSPGLVGAMMGGIKTVSLIDGILGFPKIMATVLLKSKQTNKSTAYSAKVEQ